MDSSTLGLAPIEDGKGGPRCEAHCGFGELQIARICRIGWAGRVSRAAQPAISISAQESILGEATTLDAPCALVEAVFVLVTVGHAFKDQGNFWCHQHQSVSHHEFRVTFPPECSQQLDQVDVKVVSQDFLRGLLPFSFGVPLWERCRAKLNQNLVVEFRALQISQGSRWADLIVAATQHGGRRGSPEGCQGRTTASRAGGWQVSRARHELTCVVLAPQNDETFGELRGRRAQERESPIPQSAGFRSSVTVILDSSKFAKCFQTAPTGSSLGPGGCTNEILKVCLEDTERFELLTSAAENLVRAIVPRDVSVCSVLISIIVLPKRRRGVRGIAIGTSFRRLLASASSPRRWKQFARLFSFPC